MKKILFIYPSMILGGSTTSLLSLMNCLDPEKYDIDLQLQSNSGPLFADIPSYVNVLPPAGKYAGLSGRIMKTVKFLFSAMAIKAFFYQFKKGKNTFNQDILSEFWAKSLSRKNEKQYDYAIGFLEGWSNWYLANNVIADKKYAWLHSTFTKITENPQMQLAWMKNVDKIVFVTEPCTDEFKKTLPEMADKAITIENITDDEIIKKEAKVLMKQMWHISDIKKLLKKNRDSIIVCDILNQSIAAAARKAGKDKNVPVVGIVTDVPGHYVTDSQKKPPKNPIKKWMKNFTQKNISQYDAFLFLTKAMNDVVNKNNKPYIVIEGHSDIEMKDKENSFENKSEPKVIMYAGGVSKIYGLEMLVNAFRKIENDNWELHIYGKGDYDDELSEVAKKDAKVKFFGIVPNVEVVERQLAATLLVNPRPTNEDYVKYSFPSKTLECMVSGTPLITTALPGMPKEYNAYVYLFDEETEDGFARTLERTMAIDEKRLYDKGASAKKFALEEKNNIVQAEKFYKFLEESFLTFKN